MNIIKTIQSKNFQISIATGYGIALIVIALLIFSVTSPNPAWGKNWFIRPLIITPIAGAAGGLAFYIVNQIKISRLLRIVVGTLLFIICLWLGIVLGLDGTLWN